jgi:hypothetical protein
VPIGDSRCSHRPSRSRGFHVVLFGWNQERPDGLAAAVQSIAAQRLSPAGVGDHRGRTVGRLGIRRFGPLAASTSSTTCACVGGSPLFMNGGSAVRPNVKVPGTAVAFAADSAYVGMLIREDEFIEF